MRLTGFAFIAIFSACSTTSQQGAPTTVATAPKPRTVATDAGNVIRSYDPTTSIAQVSASPSVLFAAVTDAYQELGIEVKLSDPNTGEVGNKRFSAMYRLAGAPVSTYLGCGLTTTGPAADSYRVTISLVSQITPSGSGSQLGTELTATADDLASSKGHISCMTTGALEQKIADLAIKHLGG